jgi:hypothetical protein
MDLHQLQVSYEPDEDRILMRTSFKTDAGKLQEIRAWLTRRLVSNLWPGIIRALETQVALDRPQAAHAKSEIVSLEYQSSINEIRSKGNFDAAFETAADAYPAGQAPLLVNSAQFTVGVNQALRINFMPAQDAGFEVTFTPTVLHGFCTLLQQAVKAAEWGLDLRMSSATPDYSARPKVLN